MRVRLPSLPAAAVLLALASAPGRAGAFLSPSGGRSPSSHAHAPLYVSNDITSTTDVNSDLSKSQAAFFGFDPPTEIDGDNTPPSLQVR